MFEQRSELGVPIWHMQPAKPGREKRVLMFSASMTALSPPRAGIPSFCKTCDHFAESEERFVDCYTFLLQKPTVRSSLRGPLRTSLVSRMRGSWYTYQVNQIELRRHDALLTTNALASDVCAKPQPGAHDTGPVLKDLTAGLWTTRHSIVRLPAGECRTEST
eukprot:scaffold706_cov418-Prasinococcus_capsulatus_cf.AAC.25